MKHSLQLVLTFVFFLIIVNPLYADNKIGIKVPPTSLAQWYKPQNKRQVWLHTMFRLRREMLAIEEYADNNQKLMQKWISKLETDYNQISEMVPEWSSMIDTALITELKQRAEMGQPIQIKKYLRRIQKTCDNCHHEYKPLVTALYRSPDYNEITVTGKNGTTLSFAKSMRELPKSINRIQISLEDGQPDIAQKNSARLSQQFKQLSASCQQCHHDNPAPGQRIFGSHTTDRLQQLDMFIKNNKIKQSKKMLGEIGVTVCARCHSIHRTLGDLRNTLEDRINSE